MNSLPVEIVTIIVSSLDNSSLKRLSCTRAWPEIALAIRSYGFWFLRVENQLGKRLTFVQQDWKTIFYDLSKLPPDKLPPDKQDDLFIDLSRLDCETTLALRTLLAAGYFPSEQSIIPTLRLSATCNQPDFLVVMLEDERVKNNSDLIYDLYMKCVGLGNGCGKIVTSYLTAEQFEMILNSFRD